MKKFITIFAVLGLTLLLLCGCKTQSTLSSAQKAATENATNVVCSASVYDGDTVVYKYSKEMLVRAGDNAMSVTVTESKLDGSDFTLKDTTNVETYQLDRSKLQLLSFDGNAVVSEEKTSETDEKEKTLSGTVAKDNVAAFLNTTLQAESDATFNAIVYDGKMQQFQLTFNIMNDTFGELKIEITYTYEF